MMRLARLMLATVVAVGVTYVAWPYAILYQVGSAIKDGDCATLEALVDWHAVREGIKEDICDLVVDEPAPRSASALPAFGATFMRGVAANAIDRSITPQALLAVSASPIPASTVTQELRSPMALRDSGARVTWAFFESPTVFAVSLQAKGHAEPIKLEMVLTHGAWRIDRVWLPPTLLSERSDRT